MSNNIDLFYVHLFNDFSGSPRVLRDAIDSKVMNTSNTFIFTSRHAGFLDDADAKRVNCFYARSSNRFIQLFYFLIAQFFIFFQLSYYLLKCTFKKKKSIVVINTMLPFGAGLAAKFFGGTCIYYVHETYIKPDALKHFLRLFIENCATHVIFVSKYLQKIEKFSKPKQDVIYNGLRTDFPLVSEVNTELKFCGKQLFFAGSLKEYKGIKQLLTIAELLPEFYVVAALNCEEAELELFMHENTIPSNTTLYSRPVNIQRYFERSFAVLNLSLPDGWVETFGLSLIEGMAYGSPVVSPPIGGPTEFVHDKNGLLVDARKVSDIVTFIRYLNGSVALWNSYSEQAFISAKAFTAAEYKQSFKQYFKHHGLV
jgi:glycosyltransferase involved in cell wall biosynthesis